MININVIIFWRLFVKSVYVLYQLSDLVAEKSFKKTGCAVERSGAIEVDKHIYCYNSTDRPWEQHIILKGLSCVDYEFVSIIRQSQQLPIYLSLLLWKPIAIFETLPVWNDFSNWVNISKKLKLNCGIEECKEKSNKCVIDKAKGILVGKTSCVLGIVNPKSRLK